MNQLAKVISYLFHPLLVPLLGITLLMHWPSESKGFFIYDVLYHLPEMNKKGLMIVIGTLTLLAPAVSILILYLSKIISSIHLESREERKLPYALTIFYTVLAYFILYRAPEGSLSIYIYAAIFGTLISLIILYLTLSFTKISAHTTAWGGFSGFFLAYLIEVDVLYGVEVLCSIILISGIVGAARVYLKAHKANEVYLGFSIAFVVQFLITHFGWYL